MSERDVVGIMMALRNARQIGDAECEDQATTELFGMAVMQMCRIADALEVLATHNLAPIRLDAPPL